MNVLSLFDGMSCGQIALNRIGIKPCKYYASEVDKYAIKVTQANFPDTIQLGDVRRVRSINLPKIDLLIGGSPCQGFSYAGKELNFEDSRSKLFFEFVRILKECRPRYFLLENVLMRKEYRDIITESLGVEPIEINSSLVSAQNRRRLYWTNIEIKKQPEDRGIVLRDVLEDASNKVGRQVGRRINPLTGKRDDYNKDIPMQQRIEPRKDNKSGTLTTVGKDNIVILGKGNYRNLSPIECERLQTVPDNYTDHVCKTQRYKMLGNAWTIDVICHIFKNIR